MQHGDHQRRRKTSGMSPVLPQKATAPRRTFAYPAVNNTKNAGCLGLGRMLLLTGVIAYALSLLWMQVTLESSKSAVVNDTAASQKTVLIANAGKQESANIVAPGADDNTPEHLQKIVQEKLNDLGLPPDATLELCRWLSTRSDAENARIRKACADSTAPPKVYYNALPRDRYVCGQKIASQAVTLLNQRCNDDDDDIATLFPVIPTVENADALPPVVLRFRKSNLGGKLFPGCNVPCRDYGIAEINTVRSVEVDSQTSWDFTFSMEGPEYYPFLEREPDAWRKNKFYATTSFDSEVPLPYYSKAEYSIQAPAVNYNDVIHGAAFLARNCGSKNNREDLVKQLQKSDFRIDSLSQCLHNAEPPPGVKLNGKKQLILRHYLFYLAFENQCVDDYITEKLWGPFEAGVVPIYFGAPNVKEHVPNHSIIHVDDFADTTALAAYLNQVANDPQLYESYHAWRTQPLPPHFRAKYDITDTHSTCRMCRWAYAKQYGLGWNHTSQSVRELRIGPREVCLNRQGLIRQPFAEDWTDANGSRLEAQNAQLLSGEDTTCSLNKDNRVVVLGERIRRTVYYGDGVVDLLVEAVDGSTAVGAGSISLHIQTALRKPFLKRVRDGVWHLQDAQSRFTLLASPPLSISPVTTTTTEGKSSMIVQVQAFPVRMRVIVEDIDTFHQGAKKEENYFGQSMAESFFLPVESFLVLNK